MKVELLTTVNSHKAGGLYYSVKFLAKSLIDYGIDVGILSYNDNHSINDLQTYQGIPMHTYKISPILKALGIPKNCLKKLKTLSPEIVHQQGIWMANSISLSNYRKYNKNVKTVIAPRGMLDSWAINNSSLKKKIAGHLFEYANLRKASCIHALCESEYESFRAFGLKNPVAIIPNGTIIPTYKRSYISKKKRTLLFLGRIHSKKGISELIEAINLINQNSPSLLENWEIQIGGWGDENYCNLLQEECRSKKLMNYVKFIGSKYNEEKENCLINADAFILPSYSEGLPMAVLEAWAYQLPVIITEFCNLPEGFTSNSAMQISTDSLTMSKQLMQILEMPQNQFCNIGINGYNLVKTKFSWDIIGKQTIELYKWLLYGDTTPDFVKLQ